MSRYRLYPTAEQEQALLTHCGHARYVWNLAVEQHSWWTPYRGSAPNFAEQCRQLTEARADNPWLAAGLAVVQQQSLRDFDQAMRSMFRGAHRRPTWRKASEHESFRIVGITPQHIRRVARKTGEVRVPKVGHVRFRWSREPGPAKSFRISRDRAGRWHVAFALIPVAIKAPGNGAIVGVDRGVAIAATLSTGDMLRCPLLPPGQAARVVRLERRLAKAKRGSHRRTRVKARAARLKARRKDIRRDWVEKASTDLARRFDLIRFENLNIGNMTRSARGTVAAPGRHVQQKAGLNREILAAGWGRLAERTEDKAPGRVEKVSPAFTSQTCSVCRTRDREARESQAVFRCRSCGYTGNADVNAARNIAAGYAVTARGGAGLPDPTNREPQRSRVPTV